MLKCRINKKRRMSWVRGSGTAREVLLEIAILIMVVYQGLMEKNPEVAKAFKNELLGVLLDPRSPVWKEEDHG